MVSIKGTRGEDNINAERDHKMGMKTFFLVGRKSRRSGKMVGGFRKRTP